MDVILIKNKLQIFKVHAHGNCLLPAGSAALKAPVQIESDPGKDARVLKQGKQRKENGHGREHDRDHPACGSEYAVYKQPEATGGKPADRRAHDRKASIRKKAEESRSEGMLAPRRVSQNRKNRKKSMTGKAVHFPVRSRSRVQSRFSVSEGGG